MELSSSFVTLVLSICVHFFPFLEKVCARKKEREKTEIQPSIQFASHIINAFRHPDQSSALKLVVEVVKQ